jgi:3-deoxy-manno-octulosonate cytidylyltransferase (CMP-KDO synthetase)
MASSRFPGKALMADTGKPLVVHVLERALQARRIDRVLVAAPDPEIIKAVQDHGGEAILTRENHPNGTSRLAEVAEMLDPEYDILVNVQGDEPEIDPETIDLVVETLQGDPESPVATIASPFSHEEDIQDPNLVKVVRDQRSRALLFSRAPIPFDRDVRAIPEAMPLRHVGIYAYRRPFLAEFASWPPTPLEKSEQLEQLRILENGRSIAVAVGAASSHGIDTPEQYALFLQRHKRTHPA